MFLSVREVGLALPHPTFPVADWGDAFEVVTSQRFDCAEEAASCVIGQMPAWSQTLIALRDRLVRPLGLKTGKDISAMGVRCIGFFPLLESHRDHVVLGAHDKHLDFRLVVTLHEDGVQQRVRLATLVKRNNVMGRAYLAAIMPFHKLIARATLNTIA